MVTLNSADSALKSFYLDAVAESLNTKINPFLAKIERTSNYVTGKEVRKAVRVGINGGVAAGAETGNLPTAKQSHYRQMVTELKNLYGTIEISDKAVRASANNEGAFVNLVNEEMKSLIQSAQFQFGRMLFGDGAGTLGKITNKTTERIFVSNIQNFAVGMSVDVVGAGENFQGVVVEEVDYVNESIRLNSVGEISDALLNKTIVLSGTQENELTGLAAIFSEEDLYGLTREEMGMRPYIETDVDEFDPWLVQIAMDKIEAASGRKVDFMICSWGVRRAIQLYCNEHNISLKTYTTPEGFTAIDWMGIPLVVDRFCPKGTMYLLTTDCFKLCQLCDWQWLEAEDGKILKQVPGKPVYTATLVKYAELICENPAAQGMLTGIIEG